MKHVKKFNESIENTTLSMEDMKSFSFTYDDLKIAFEEGWKDYSNNWHGGRDKGKPNFENWFNDWFKKNYV